MVEETNVEQTATKTDTPTPTGVQDTKQVDDTAVDLITRVSQVKSDVAKPTEDNTDKFDFNDIAKIENPEAREIALKAYKSIERGGQKKFQEIAAIRKALEAKQDDYSNWTPEKITTLLKDEAFVKAAQQAAGVSNSPTNDDTLLSPAEQEKFNTLFGEVNTLKQRNAQLELENQHKTLGEKYANYDRSNIHNVVSDFQAGRRQITLEDVFRSTDYEAAVNRAYKLGKSESSGLMTEKINATTVVDGLNVIPTRTASPQNDGESDHSYFLRLGMENIKKFNSGTLPK